jgi:hypothetical protein
VSIPDAINGAFELLGSVAIFAHCAAVMKDKQVKGVSWHAVLFFTAWGYWNLYYYPHLGQWLSFTGGLFIVAGNTAWIVLILKYRDRATARR